MSIALVPSVGLREARLWSGYRRQQEQPGIHKDELKLMRPNWDTWLPLASSKPAALIMQVTCRRAGALHQGTAQPWCQVMRSGQKLATSMEVWQGWRSCRREDKPTDPQQLCVSCSSAHPHTTCQVWTWLLLHLHLPGLLRASMAVPYLQPHKKGIPGSTDTGQRNCHTHSHHSSPPSAWHLDAGLSHSWLQNKAITKLCLCQTWWNCPYNPKFTNPLPYEDSEFLYLSLSGGHLSSSWIMSSLILCDLSAH